MNPLTEQQVIEIIRRELGSYFNSDRSVIEKPLTQFLDGRNIQLGTGTGTKIGTGTNQKLGFFNASPVVQQAALTTQLTTITHSSQGTPDYVLADVVNGGWGLSTADEARTLLSVIRNLQIRLAEVETAVENLGLLASN